MLPFFIVVAGLCLGLLYDPQYASSWFDTRLSCAAVAALVALQLAAGRLVRTIAARRPESEPWEKWVGNVIRAANAYRVLALPLYAAAVWVFNWPRVVDDSWRLEGVPFVALFLRLLPLVLLVLATFFGLHAAESAGRGERLPLKDYLAFHARMGLVLPLVPAFLVFSIFECLALSATLRTLFEVFPFLTWIVLLAVVLAFVAGAPAFMRLLWGATPLPDSPLKRRLDGVADAAGIARPGFYVWPTRGFAHVNAAVVGVTAKSRIVLFTDALLATFTEEEIGGVLAHELGHARHRHLVFYFAMALGSAFFVTFLDDSLRDVTADAVRTAAAIAVLAVAAGAGFGFFSRRFERQADLFAARLVPAATYIQALEKVGTLNGDVRKVWFFTHMSIEQRVNYLIEAGVRPEAAGLFERKLRRAVTAALAFALFSFGGALYTVARQVEAAPQRRKEIDARQLDAQALAAWNKNDRDAAVALARRAADLDDAWAFRLGEFLFAQGRPFDAAPEYERAKPAWPPDSEESRLIRDRLDLIETLRKRKS